MAWGGQFEWRVPGGRPIMHREEFGWPIFRAARKLGPGYLIPLGFGSSKGDLLWLTKNRPTATSGLKKKVGQTFLSVPGYIGEFCATLRAGLG